MTLSLIQASGYKTRLLINAHCFRAIISPFHDTCLAEEAEGGSGRLSAGSRRGAIRCSLITRGTKVLQYLSAIVMRVAIETEIHNRFSPHTNIINADV